MVNADRCMCSTIGGWITFWFKLFPSLVIVVADECITCNYVFTFIEQTLPVSPTAPPNKMALSLPIGVIVWPKRAMGLSPSNFTYSISFLFSFYKVAYIYKFKIQGLNYLLNFSFESCYQTRKSFYNFNFESYWMKAKFISKFMTQLK